MADGSPPDPESVLESALTSLWNAVSELTRLMPLDRQIHRVCIFGSARTRPGDPAYEKTKLLASELARRGYAIITGGGPGLMQAANEGERLGDPDGSRRSIGIRVELPFEQGVNPFVEQAYTHRTFFTRLAQFARLSDAFVVVDGGIGTTLETLMIWQLLQVKHLQEVPLVFVGSMWRDLTAWAKGHMLRADGALASPHDLDIPICVETCEEAVKAITDRLSSR
jgi:hypothetical protein